ncbi:hypothetical protein [Daejeonella lutea]|uniref:Uncharacterized protein n=1 Tax=Daejeonella lutea TaxID=572036 RepID=A0A1T5EI80_9SPHI|nr:hypothetical protein [Daejeonella lutea]SKB83667.1 hypothetical protein SAMN05661099_3035 [Daejeonella lutea]
MKFIHHNYNRTYRFFLSGLIGALAFFVSIGASGQTVDFYKGSDCTIATSSDISTGCTATNYIFVQYQNFPQGGLNLPAGWTLKVQANGDFTNGTNVISAQYVSIGFNSVDGGPSGVSGTGNQALSKITPATLINTTTALQSPPHYYFVHKLNMTIAGGSHLLAGSGTYSTTLTLTLVAQNGTIVATNSNVPVSFIVSFNNSCTGATINSYFSNQPVFTDYAAQMAGRTVTDAVSIQYAPNQAVCTGWSLKVRANGNFMNGSNSVPAQYFALRFNRVASGSPTAAQIGVTNNAVALAYSDVALIDQSDQGFTAYAGTEHKFDMIIAGGNHLLVPNGTYTASLTFTLYNQNNQVVSTKIQDVSFQINSSTNSYTVVLQNSSNVVNMVFNTLANYQSGVSVSKARGLKVTGYSGYQILIKTSGSNLENENDETIPVGAVNVETTKFTSTNGAAINVYTRALSTADQIIINNPVSHPSHQVVEYNLRYYTAAADSRLLNKSGTFNTTVLFIAIPR